MNGLWLCIRNKNAFLNVINHQPDIDKIYLYTLDLFKAKHHLLINELKSIGLKHFDNPKAFIEYLDDWGDVDQNIYEY